MVPGLGKYLDLISQWEKVRTSTFTFVISDLDITSLEDKYYNIWHFGLKNYVSTNLMFKFCHFGLKNYVTPNRNSLKFGISYLKITFRQS